MVRRVGLLRSPCLCPVPEHSSPRRGRRVSRAATLILLFACAAVSTAWAQAAPLATVGLTTGWVTFGQAVPQGLATGGLQVGGFATQTDIKTRWPDGSIRFAVMTVNVPASGNYPITAASPVGGGIAPAMPIASVNLTIAGRLYTASLPNVPSAASVWLAGPDVWEGRFVVTPASPGGDHPFLRVNF